MAYFVHPPDMIHAQDFLHVNRDIWTDLALNPYGVNDLVMVANNPNVLEVSREQELRSDGLIHFKVFGKGIGYSFLDACVGGNGGPSWGKAQVIVGEGTWSPPPRKVAQRTNWTCWAAAMESYLSTRTSGAHWNQDYLGNVYGVGDRGQLLTDGNAAERLGYPRDRCAVQLYSDLGIVYDDWTGPKFTFDYIHMILKKYKYAMLTYTAGHLASDGSAYSHVVVAYACRKEPPPYGETVSVMDPNEHGNYDTWPIGHFQQYSTIIVAWQR